MGKVLRGPFFFQPLLPSHGRFAAKWNVLPRKKHILAYGFTLSITSAAGARMAPANAKTQRQRTIRKPLACVPQYVTRQQPACCFRKEPDQPLPPEPPCAGTQSTTQSTLFTPSQPKTTRASSVAAAALTPREAFDRCARQTMTSRRWNG